MLCNHEGLMKKGGRINYLVVLSAVLFQIWAFPDLNFLNRSIRRFFSQVRSQYTFLYYTFTIVTRLLFDFLRGNGFIDNLQAL
jgi:hypothetical protein